MWFFKTRRKLGELLDQRDQTIDKLKASNDQFYEKSLDANGKCYGLQIKVESLEKELAFWKEKALTLPKLGKENG